MSGKMIPFDDKVPGHPSQGIDAEADRDAYEREDSNTHVLGVSEVHIETESKHDVFTYEISDKWSHVYQGVEVAVVTNVEKPARPPLGYVPLRRGIRHQSDASEDTATRNPTQRFSLDTLLWTESLLEERLEELIAWKRRPPLTLRDKLDQINWLITSK